MPRYRKKPVVIDAIQWDGTIPKATMIINWILSMGGTARYHGGANDHLVIDTLEGPHRAISGDWIIKGVQNEFYPCKPDIFDATYEQVYDDTVEAVVQSGEYIVHNPDVHLDHEGIIDPDCKAGKHKSCIGRPCECWCHITVDPDC